MDVFYEKIMRPILFSQNPEFAHDMALKAMQVVSAVPPLRMAMEYLNLVKTQKPVKVFGLEFPNRVGLAAGFDKDAYVWRAAPHSASDTSKSARSRNSNRRGTPSRACSATPSPRQS